MRELHKVNATGRRCPVFTPFTFLSRAPSWHVRTGASRRARPALLAPPACAATSLPQASPPGAATTTATPPASSATCDLHVRRSASEQMALSLGKLVLLAPCLVGALYTADGGSKLAVQPVRLVRLLNSVYGAEHLLLFGREEECVHTHSSQSHPPTRAQAQ